MIKNNPTTPHLPKAIKSGKKGLLKKTTYQAVVVLVFDTYGGWALNRLYIRQAQNPFIKK